MAQVRESSIGRSFISRTSSAKIALLSFSMTDAIQPPKAPNVQPKLHLAAAFVPTGQPDNSPAFQRRVSVSTGTSPNGTAERTAHDLRHCNFILKNPVVPAGLGIFAD